MERLTNLYEREKKWLFFALMATFLWGMLAHGYCFFDNNFSHDSLLEWNGPDNSYAAKMTRGRVFIRFYHGIFRGKVTVPWLVGCVSLFWMGLATFFTIRVLDVKSKVTAALIAGILTTNISIAAMAATFMHDLDCDTFALMCALLAVYIWRQNWKWGFVLGAFPICLSLGIYQAYVFTAASLVMIVSILDLLQGKKAGEVTFNGLKAIAMLALGGVLYYIAMTRLLSWFGLTLASGGKHSILSVLKMTPEQLPALIGGAYQDVWDLLVDPFSMYPTTLQDKGTRFLMWVCGTALAIGLVSRKLGLWEKLLAVVLAVLLPPVMDMIYILTLGVGHELTAYSVWLVLVLALMLSGWLWEQFRERKILGKPALIQKGLCLAIVAGLLYTNVMYDNQLYLKKDAEADAYLSLMTRVSARMEMEEEYKPGETLVVFVGLPKDGQLLYDVMPGYESVRWIYGMGETDVVAAATNDRIAAYIEQVLGTPMNLPDWPLWLELNNSERAKTMPCYPAQGCITFLEDGTMLVKLGEV